MRGPLTVRIHDGITSRMVTRYVTQLKFRKTAPGGYADASCFLDLPADAFTDLGPADRVFVYDGRTAQTLWEGYTNNPGQQYGLNGQGFDLSALGSQILASDQSERLIYLDASYDAWTDDWEFAKFATAISEIGQFPDGTTKAGAPAIFCQFPPGQPINDGYRAAMRYRGFEGSGMHLGALAGVYYAGTNSAGGLLILRWNTPTVNVFDANASTAIAALVLYAGVTFTAASDADQIGFVYRRNSGGATNVATDTVWGAFGEVKVLGHLLDRNGTMRPMSTTAHITSGGALAVTEAYVLAHEVVEDLLGRLLTTCDPATAVIDGTPSYHIDQLTYRDGARAAQVLDDLALYEPDYLWEILESNPAGLHRFNYRTWPTTARYRIPPSLEVEQTGSDVDLCNRIYVNWIDALGNPQVTVRTSTVPELGTRTRDADPITLPEGMGSQLNAERIGDQVLATKGTAPQAAKLTVDRPIMDMLTGSTVQPWEIDPGYMARIQATDQNLRVTEVEYDDEACAATLTLGDPVLTIEQRIARLERTPTPERAR